ncbi:MAG: hypothetical protein AAB830_02375 [Patescibacteria group bacterium]
MPDTEHEEWLKARNKARGEHLKHHHTPRKKADDEKKKGGDDKKAWRYRGPLDTD